MLNVSKFFFTENRFDISIFPFLSNFYIKKSAAVRKMRAIKNRGKFGEIHSSCLLRIGF